MSGSGSLRYSPSLPTEGWAHILSFLAPHECFPVALTCRLFCEILRHQRRARGEGAWRTWAGIALASEAMMQWTKDLGRPLLCVREWGGIGEDWGRFRLPLRMFVQHMSREVLVTDSGNNRVQVLCSDTGQVLRQIGPSQADASASKEDVMRGPEGVAVRPDTGEVFVSEYANNRISVWAMDGRFLRSFGNGSRDARGGHRPSYPAGLCLSTGGPEPELYVCDFHNHRVQVLDPETGRCLRSLGSHGSGRGQLDRPVDVRVSAAGDEVYVSDCWNHRICVFRPDGKLLRVLGGGEGAGAGQLQRPSGIALTGAGTLLVCDMFNHRVQELRCSDGACVRRWGREGCGRGRFVCPRGVAVRGDGAVLVCDGHLADPRGHRIQVFL